MQRTCQMPVIIAFMAGMFMSYIILETLNISSLQYISFVGINQSTEIATANIHPPNITIPTTTTYRQYTQLKVDGLKIDEFISNSENCDDKLINDKVLLLDSIPLHSVGEMNLIALRIFELCEYVDLFVIMEIMYYPDGTLREKSIWSEKEKYLNLTKMLQIKNCDASKIVYHAIYRNIYAEGYVVGKRGETLQRVFFDEIRRTLIVELVWEDCFKYFGDNKCRVDNMDNVYMIFSDTDEIPRYSAAKLVKKCNNKIADPIVIDMWWHAYDFGCHLVYTENREIKILSLKWVNPDLRLRQAYKYRAPIRLKSFQQKYDTNITLINNGGWHLTYFGDAKRIVDKNKHKAHLYERRGNYVNQQYQQCQLEICSLEVFSKRSMRMETVNRSDLYYPLFVTNLSMDEIYDISPFLGKRININKTLYEKWQIYWNSSETHNVEQQRAFCKLNS